MYKKQQQGMYIRWYSQIDKIFPDYRDISGSLVTKKRLKVAIKKVQDVLEQTEPIIHQRFIDYVNKKYNSSHYLFLDMNFAIEKLGSAKISSIIKPTDDVYGFTYNRKIWITSMKMSDELLVGTLLHEALHDICTVNGKNICEDGEHQILRSLGDHC